ncbi:MAG: PIN domain-containing protein [Euryarchaeota archaeon]|nr:PIN domain-containing protein [Euryarchaeota archaeon]
MNRIVLDTNVLWNPEAMSALLARPLEVVLPSIVLAERVRQIRARDQDVDLFLDRVRMLGWKVEPLGREEALRYTGALIEQDVWNAHSRDAFIAGHVRPGDSLWTANVKDFVRIGVPAEQIQRV